MELCTRFDLQRHTVSQETRRSEEFLQRAEAKFDIYFAPGRSTDIDFMAHLWEPLRWIHKPLFVYLGAEMMWVATDALLYTLGFRVHRHQVSRNPKCLNPKP